jgi:hypothetical protein
MVTVRRVFVNFLESKLTTNAVTVYAPGLPLK